MIRLYQHDAQTVESMYSLTPPSNIWKYGQGKNTDDSSIEQLSNTWKYGQEQSTDDSSITFIMNLSFRTIGSVLCSQKCSYMTALLRDLRSCTVHLYYTVYSSSTTDPHRIRILYTLLY